MLFTNTVAFNPRRQIRHLQKRQLDLPLGVQQSPQSTSERRAEDKMVADETSVLRELKETIEKQANQITALKNELSKSTESATRSRGGGHGAPSEVSQEELIAYVKQPFYQTVKKRIVWLGLFLVSLSLTALIMSEFEHTLEKQIELAYFVPLLAGHGGNTGGQVVGTVLSAMSAGLVTLSDAAYIIGKESLSGLLAGGILGVIVGPVAHYLMGISIHVSTVILFTLPVVSAIAATLGAAIPFACVAAGLEPSVIAGPAMTSLVDIGGLMAYFWIANQVFALFEIKL